MDAKEILLKILKIDSPSKKEEELANFLFKEIRKYGFEAIIEKDEVCNVVLGRSDFFIVTHMDTIRRQRKIKVNGEKIYGEGVSDAKASITSILLFLKKAKKLNLSIAFLSDEEEDAKGSEFFLKKHKPKIAIIMEPTSLKFCNYHAGNIEANFEIEGKESHGSFCDENAIDKFLQMANEIKSMKYWKKGLYFDSCISFQEIICQNPFYLNPGKCYGRIDARILAEQDAHEISNEIKNVIIKYGKIEFKEIWNGFVMNDDEIISICKRAAEKSNIDFKLDGMPSWTDAIKFNEKGIKCIVFGPGNLKISHTKNEYTEIKEIEKAAKFLYMLNEILTSFPEKNRYSYKL